jgi:hypothetical protein
MHSGQLEVFHSKTSSASSQRRLAQLCFLAPLNEAANTLLVLVVGVNHIAGIKVLGDCWSQDLSRLHISVLIRKPCNIGSSQGAKDLASFVKRKHNIFLMPYLLYPIVDSSPTFGCMHDCKIQEPLGHSFIKSSDSFFGTNLWFGLIAVMDS